MIFCPILSFSAFFLHSQVVCCFSYILFRFFINSLNIRIYFGMLLKNAWVCLYYLLLRMGYLFCQLFELFLAIWFYMCNFWKVYFTAHFFVFFLRKRFDIFVVFLGIYSLHLFMFFFFQKNVFRQFSMQGETKDRWGNCNHQGSHGKQTSYPRAEHCKSRHYGCSIGLQCLVDLG